MSEAERALLSRYVSNLDGDIYAIYNLPEEVVAVVFAYVSRSPKSFRANLAQLLKEDSILTNADHYSLTTSNASARAAAFHERWVIGYGHSSVAEHSVAHLGMERISRLASAQLELANPFLSFTEYSQRYQKPKRGHYVVPTGLSPALCVEYKATMEALYDSYEELYLGLYKYLDQSEPQIPNENEKQRQVRLEKKAFEDARYALPLATFTSLGLTGNARALRDCIAWLAAADEAEVRQMAAAMEAEVQKVLPTLLRHSQPSVYQKSWQAQLTAAFQRQPEPNDAADRPAVQLLRYSGQGELDPQRAAIDILAAAICASDVCGDSEAVVAAALEGLGPHDTLPEAFCWINYDALLYVSEANWHQLLRHCRGMRFQASPPQISNGYTVPPTLLAAGLEGILAKAISHSEALYKRLYNEVPSTAGYAVINAHRRRVRTLVDLRQLYHLVNLRLSNEAQWDIRQTVSQLYQRVCEVHPRLCQQAYRR